MMEDNSDLLKMNSETKTKYITSEFPGAPELKNTWGSLAKMLKTVLSEGFYTITVSRITCDLTTKILTVFTEFNHSLNQGTVIKLENVITPQISGEYRVLDYGKDYIKVQGNSTLSVEEVQLDSNCTLSIASLGYDIIYDRISTTGEIVFKNKSRISPAVIKIIDIKPPNGYDTSWVKFARIVGGQNMLDIDTFVNNEKFPTISGFPNAEKTGNNVSGRGGIHGYARWYYALPKTSATTEISTPLDADFPTKWKIVGDDKTFYLLIKTMGNSYSGYTIYSFGNYISNDTRDTGNILMHAVFNFERAETSIGAHLGLDSYYYGSASNKFNVQNHYGALALFKNSYRGISSEFLGYHFGLSISDVYERYPTDSNKINAVSSNTSKKITSPIFIKDKNLEFRGYLRGISQMYGQVFSNVEGLLPPGDSLILNTRKSYWSDTNSNENVPYIFSLQDWEEV